MILDNDVLHVIYRKVAGIVIISSLSLYVDRYCLLAARTRKTHFPAVKSKQKPKTCTLYRLTNEEVCFQSNTWQLGPLRVRVMKCLYLFLKFSSYFRKVPLSFRIEASCLRKTANRVPKYCKCKTTVEFSPVSGSRRGSAIRKVCENSCSVFYGC